jgi:hypothetical protein
MISKGLSALRHLLPSIASSQTGRKHDHPVFQNEPPLDLIVVWLVKRIQYRAVAIAAPAGAAMGTDDIPKRAMTAQGVKSAIDARSACITFVSSSGGLATARGTVVRKTVQVRELPVLHACAPLFVQG